MSDLIRIVDLEVSSVIGVHPEEREKYQRLLVTLELRVKDIGPAAYTDNIKMAVDYAAVAEHVKATASLRTRNLIETLAEEIATDLLKTFAIVGLRLEIMKFALPDAKHVAIIIERPVSGRLPTAYWPSPTRALQRTRELPPIKDGPAEAGSSGQK
jgi:dihydroneopterin aldolase